MRNNKCLLQSAARDSWIFVFAKGKPFDLQLISCQDPSLTRGFAEEAQRKAQFSPLVSPSPLAHSPGQPSFSFVESRTQFFGRVPSMSIRPSQNSSCFPSSPCLRISAVSAEFSSAVSISTIFASSARQCAWASSQVKAFWPNLKTKLTFTTYLNWQ